MKPLPPGLAARFTLVALGLLVTGCVCVQSAEIENQTDKAVFVNLVSRIGGELYERPGQVIPAHTVTTIEWTLEDYIRIRDLSGATVLFSELDDDLEGLLVASLEPARDAPPLAPMYGTEGPSRSSFIVCDGSSSLELQATTMGIRVTNASLTPLVLITFEPFLDLDEPPSGHGVLLPPNSTYKLFATAVRETWIYGFTPGGEKVFVKNLGLSTHYDLTIDDPLPAIQSLERLDLKRRSPCGGPLHRLLEESLDSLPVPLPLLRDLLKRAVDEIAK